MYARDVMTATVFVVDPNATVAHARNLMVRHHISRLPVMEDGKLAGIITKKDIAYRMRQAEPAWRRRPLDRIPVGALMTEIPLVVAPDTSVREIARMFVDKNISSVPVVDEGVVRGIVTKTDLMKSALVRALTCPAGDVMEDVATVSRYHSLDHVVGVMRERNDKVLVTDDDGTPAGIITETNLAFYEDEPKISGVVEKDIAIRRRETADGPGGQNLMVIPPVAAEDLMTSPVITVHAETLLPDAIALMERHHVNSLVVMDESTIVGILKRDDIIKEVAK
ncbi:CBS domain-containing protein [Methanoregula sp.]|uniref:CBS domain-containing protein n=1 Tax=Methanoregula sp. TaxID=2052170 RepID=UPI002373F07C|nr:CBS domain-containing protein [Methanoregula sp.]MDD1687723.1 CBS domain-containing protein [Methanoregula sp.]